MIFQTQPFYYKPLDKITFTFTFLNQNYCDPLGLGGEKSEQER